MGHTQYDYLMSTKKYLARGYLDCCTSTNFDEAYVKIYPPLSKGALLSLIAKYPDPEFKDLIKKIKSKFKIENLMLGSGSEDLIVKCNRVIEKNNWQAGIVFPTFYRIHETLQRYTPLNSDSLFSKKIANLKAVWLVNPNPLTGEIINKEKLLKLFKKNRGILFLVDEASIFFITHWEKYSLLNYCTPRKNFVVISSFSKLHGLAGLRIGFLSGNQKFLDQLKIYTGTFPITNPSAYFLSKLLDIKEIFFDSIRSRIETNKKEILSLLSKDPTLVIMPSVTNGIFCKRKNGNLFKELLKTKVISLNLDSQRGISNKGFVRLIVHSSKKLHKKLKSRLKKIINKK